MFTRCLLAISVCTALGLLVAAAPFQPVDKIYSGVVVSAGSGKLVLSDFEGNNEVALMITDRATVMLDGVPAKLVDLLKGDMVSATVGDDGQVVSVVAKRTKK